MDCTRACCDCAMWIWGRHFTHMLCYLYPSRNSSNGPVWYFSALWDSSPLLGWDLTWLERKVRCWGWKYGFLEVTMMGMLVLIISLMVSQEWSLSWGVAVHTWRSQPGFFLRRGVCLITIHLIFFLVHICKLRVVPSTVTFISVMRLGKFDQFVDQYVAERLFHQMLGLFV